MASFGWSAGDIIATISLVNRVVQSISGAHDARDHFQELVSELRALSRALHEISELIKIPGQTPEIQALKFASCSCSETLQRFYKKVRPFENALGAGSTRSKIKAAPRMVRWELLIKKDVPELRSYLVAHVGSLNLRLSTALLKASSNSQLQAYKIDQKHSMNADLLQQLTKEQAGIVEKINLIPKADTVPKLDSLLSIAMGVWKLQNEIVLSLEKASQSLPSLDLDHTWAQAPVKFEDALGRRFLIPSEYDWDMIEAIIHAKFKKGPGCVKVRSGDYELFDQRTGRCISELNFLGLIPGSYITMTIVVGRYRGRLVREVCARYGCGVSRLKRINLELNICMECQSVFRKSYRILPRPMKPINSDPMAGQRKDMEEDDPYGMHIRHYKNVSIYSVELPATPTKFRDKYPRYYSQTQPPIQIFRDLRGYVIQQTDNNESAAYAEESPMAASLQKQHWLPSTNVPITPQGNSHRIHSMLQRPISNMPALVIRPARFHTSAQERFSPNPRRVVLLSAISHNKNPIREPLYKIPEEYPSLNSKVEKEPWRWKLDEVTAWLATNNFSKYWVKTFTRLNIIGCGFINLGAPRENGEEYFGFLHAEIFRTMAEFQVIEGDKSQIEREVGEGERLRKLIRDLIPGQAC